MNALKPRTFNEKVAQIVNDATGNMWFFWAALIFIVVLRILQPPRLSEFLLDTENDLQLLVLAANAVVLGKQYRATMRLLEHMERQVREMDHQVVGAGKDLSSP